LAQLRRRIYEAHPRLQRPRVIEPAAWGRFGDAAGVPTAEPFRSPIENFYMTDPIGRASETMAACTERLLGRRRGTGTHG
jgi:NADH-quinone oxidoreductase subunit G